MDISIMEIVGILITLFVSSMVMQFSPNHLKVSFYCDYLSEVIIYIVHFQKVLSTLPITQMIIQTTINRYMAIGS